MEQTLYLRKDKPIVINTPVGFIEITRGNGNNKLRITLPDSLGAFIGKERAQENNPYVEISGDSLRPRYNMLVPVVHEGSLVGVTEPQSLTLAGQTPPEKEESDDSTKPVS